MNFEFIIINKAEVTVSESAQSSPTEGLMCLDACKCIGGCDEIN